MPNEFWCVTWWYLGPGSPAALAGHRAGRLIYNAEEVVDERFKDVVGFVDQEDNLKGTLTVYESVLFSGLLRLPQSVGLAAKTQRTLEVLKELRIDHVADSYIGSTGRR